LLSLRLRPGVREGIGARCDWRTTGAHRMFKPQKGLSSVRQAEDTPAWLGREQPWYTRRAELRSPIRRLARGRRIPPEKEGLREPGAVQHSPPEGRRRPGVTTHHTTLIKLDLQAA
jgi:hypothetical protein